MPASTSPTDRSIIAPLHPLMVRKGEAAALCGGLSEETFQRLINAGKTPAPLRLGGSVLFAVAELQAWVAAGLPNRESWEAMKASASDGHPNRLQRSRAGR